MKNVSLPAPTGNLRASILGIWKLEPREDVDATGKRRVDPILGLDPLGILCFALGHFAAQFMKRSRSHQETRTRPVQGKNNSSALNGYDAYFGTHTLDETAGTLNVHLEGSISTSNVGSTFIRDVGVLNNELVIQLPTTTLMAQP